MSSDVEDPDSESLPYEYNFNDGPRVDPEVFTRAFSVGLEFLATSTNKALIDAENGKVDFRAVNSLMVQFREMKGIFKSYRQLDVPSIQDDTQRTIMLGHLHDIATPMLRISGQMKILGLLANDQGSPEQFGDAFSEILSSTKEIKEIVGFLTRELNGGDMQIQTVNIPSFIQRTLSFARSFTNGREVIIHPTGDMHTMYRSIFERERPTAKEGDKESQIMAENFDKLMHAILLTSRTNLDKEFPEDFPVDPKILKTIFLNFLSNAVKYSFQETPIEIGVRLREDMVSVYVVNQGVGINEDELEKVFDFGYRASNVRHTKIPGSGVGLGTCSRLAEQHGGYLRASQIGKSTIFEAHIPRLEEN